VLEDLASSERTWSVRKFTTSKVS